MPDNKTAIIVISDATAGFKFDENLGVLDMKIGKIYHTPNDTIDRIQTRRQKANNSSASLMGIRVTACACMDGFTVSKQKALKLKTASQISPFVKRFLYSPVDDFDRLVLESIEWMTELKEVFSQKITINVVSSSVLIVVGKSVCGSTKIKLRLIDLAHLFMSESEETGFIDGCSAMINLLNSVRC